MTNLEFPFYAMTNGNVDRLTTDELGRTSPPDIACILGQGNRR